ncbi:cutinase family protein [Streptomyces spinosirectus]
MRTRRIRFRIRSLCLAVLTVTACAAGPAVLPTPAASAATCSDIDVVVARGTFEPGTLGLVVGDPAFSALQKQLTGRSLSGYAVNYPADLSATSAAQGNADLVDHVRTQAVSCPGQRFVLVGYSQGANVVDNSIGISSDGAVVGSPIVATIPTALEPKVAAVLLFGNPIRALGRSVTGTYESRTIDFCAKGDPVCENGGNDVPAHLGYTADVDAAAVFAAGKV